MTDQGLARLAPLTNLRRLRIGRTKVTEAGLSHLALMPNIDRLELAGLPVTNSGLEALQGMSRLKSLDLSGTQIDDDALATLAKFPSLAELNVRDTGLTAEAIARFQQAHPGISVVTGKTPTGYSAWAMVIAILYVIAVCCDLLLRTPSLLADLASPQGQPGAEVSRTGGSIRRIAQGDGAASHVQRAPRRRTHH